jgi:hypothetical protein
MEKELRERVRLEHTERQKLRGRIRVRDLYVPRKVVLGLPEHSSGAMLAASACLMTGTLTLYAVGLLFDVTVIYAVLMVSLGALCSYWGRSPLGTEDDPREREGARPFDALLDGLLYALTAPFRAATRPLMAGVIVVVLGVGLAGGLYHQDLKRHGEMNQLP